MYLFLLLAFFALMMTLRAFLIVMGTYKDPVLASFEHYGEEKIFSPMFSLTVWVTLTGAVSAYIACRGTWFVVTKYISPQEFAWIPLE